MGVTSCSDDDSEPIPTPAVDYEQLKESAITEFLNYAKTPRPGFDLDMARAYIKGIADKYGWQWSRDEYGNCWIDVPATKGYKNY